jgi:hypothetical protein
MLTNSQVEIAETPYSKLVGTWKCATSFDDKGSVTRLINETVFDASGTRSIEGFVQWFDNDGRISAPYQSVTEVQLHGDTFLVDSIALNVGEPKFLGNPSSSANSFTQFKNSVEAKMDRDSQSVFDIVELNNDRFVTIRQDDGAFNVCVRKG